MSKQNKIHEETDYNHAEKTAENILHWIVSNYQIVIGVVAVILAIVWGIAKVQDQKQEQINLAKTDYASLHLTKQSLGSFNKDDLITFFDSTDQQQLAGYAAFHLGALELAAKEYDAAIEWYDNAIAKVTKSDVVLSSAYEGKGVALESTGDLNGALEMYRKALAAKNTDYRAGNVRMKIALIEKKNSNLDAVKVQCEAIVADTLASPELVKSANSLLLSL